MERLDGVHDAQVEDFESGRTLVLPEEGKGLVPAEIAKAVRDAGFTPARMSIEVVGTVEISGESRLLHVEGLKAPFALEGAPADLLMGTKIRARGELSFPKEEPARLKVETFELLR